MTDKQRATHTGIMHAHVPAQQVRPDLAVACMEGGMQKEEGSGEIIILSDTLCGLA